MTDEQRMGYPGALVVSGHDAHRDSLVGQLRERGEGPGHEIHRHPAPEEDVPPVDDEVDLATSGRGERGLESGEELGAAPPAGNARPPRQVQAEVGVGEEQDAGAGYRHPRARVRVSRSRMEVGPSRSATGPGPETSALSSRESTLRRS